MTAFHSIRWRLQFWYGLLLAAVLLGFGVAAYSIERSELERSADAELGRRADQLGRAVRRPPLGGNPRREPAGRLQDEEDRGPDDGSALPFAPGELGSGNDFPPQSLIELRLPPREADDYGPDGTGDWYYVIWRRNGSLAARSSTAPADVPRPTRADPRPNGPTLRVRGEAREAYFKMGPGDIVLVGRRMTADFQRLDHLAWLMAAAAGTILALALVGGRWLVGRSLRPIEEISSAATKIAAGNLSQRIGTRDTVSELGELAQLLNATFARLEAAFAQQARFVADAAHELRTPLTVLLTHIQNAKAVPCERVEHEEALAACQRAAGRMRALTESLLWLARLDSGAQPLKKIRFDLARRAADGLELIRPLAEKKGITIRAKLAAAECLGDPEQIDQVVTNLLTNAVDHNCANGEIRVETRMETGGASLIVADDGPGIAAADLPRVFDRFYRADQSRSRASGGFGLGLAIARAILEAHGGTIRAESEPGRGATFVVTLPS